MIPASALPALTSELKADPLGVGYAGLSPGSIAEHLNALTRSGPIDVPTATVLRKLVTTGEYGSIKAAVGLGTLNSNASLLAVVWNFVTCVENPDIPAFGSSSATVAQSVTAGLSALLTASLIGQATHDALVALMTGPISRATELALGGAVDTNDVVRALSA